MRKIVPFVFFILASFTQGLLADSRVISSLGRIEPAGGVVRLAGPSGLGSVIMDLKVKEGDRVAQGDVIALLDSYPVRKAELAQSQAELESARKQLEREKKLGKAMATSASKLEALELQVKASAAGVKAAEATLNLSMVRAPHDAQILYIHARPGDTVSSPALAAPVSGTVESIGLKVGRLDILGMDPVAEADARVIEVNILLDDVEAVNALTNLQVEVEIRP
jgi:multidrug efflux pump subunit AcrA (membrane-fusion protein)